VLSNVIQLRSKDGYTYVYSFEDRQWYALYPVVDFPLDVQEQILELKDKADILVARCNRGRR
jgi:hypothetical protein